MSGEERFVMDSEVGMDLLFSIYSYTLFFFKFKHALPNKRNFQSTLYIHLVAAGTTNDFGTEFWRKKKSG